MKYIKSDSYQEYVHLQTSQNKRKLGVVWIEDDEIKKISQHIKLLGLKINFGICHGARNGFEVEEFRKALNGANIIGTDISETAAAIPNMIVHDFHETKLEWIDATDFIYTNSIDHCYNFNKALNSWMRCLTKNGRCFISWVEENAKPINKIDCFGIELEELKSVISKKYGIERVIDVANRKIIVIKRRE